MNSSSSRPRRTLTTGRKSSAAPPDTQPIARAVPTLLSEVKQTRIASWAIKKCSWAIKKVRLSTLSDEPHQRSKPSLSHITPSPFANRLDSS
jgi:hypothetical protein